MNRRVLDRTLKAQGEEHPKTPKSVGNVAAVLDAQGKYDAAEKMNRRALDKILKTLGKEHPYTLTVISLLRITINQSLGVAMELNEYSSMKGMNAKAGAKVEQYLIGSRS